MFEGANIVRIPRVQRHDDRLCVNCDTTAKYEVHGPDESDDLCSYHLTRFLASVMWALEDEDWR
jgi:hypothetical protein